MGGNVSEQAAPVEVLSFVVADGDVESDNTMGMFAPGEAAVRLKEIPVVVLRENLDRTFSALRATFKDLTQSLGDLRLKEVQIGLEISAQGGVHLIGTAQVGAKSAITLVFGE
jgi:hypothetical protein